MTFLVLDFHNFLLVLFLAHINQLYKKKRSFKQKKTCSGDEVNKKLFFFFNFG